MDIERLRSLLSVNHWADVPVAEVWLDLSDIPEEGLPDLCRRIRRELSARLPTCPLPRLGGRDEGRALELWLARTFARVTLTLCEELGARLSSQAGQPIGGQTADPPGGGTGPSPRLNWPDKGFLHVRPLAEPGLIIVAFPYREELVPAQCAQTAMDLLKAICGGQPWDLPAALAGLQTAAEQRRPSRFALALEAAARRRAIPVRRLGSGLLQLGQGARQVRTREACSERQGAIAQWLTGERQLMRDLLASVGVACTEDPVTGPHYRLLVAGGRLAAAIRWTPAPDAPPAPPATDLSDLIHPQVRARALDAARALALDIAEVRLVMDDPSRPLETQDGRVSEVIASPPWMTTSIDAAWAPSAQGKGSPRPCSTPGFRPGKTVASRWPPSAVPMARPPSPGCSPMPSP